VKVDAGRGPDHPRIDWGDDDPHQFTALSSDVGTYDCAGVEQ
jgi:hypothetical protein